MMENAQVIEPVDMCANVSSVGTNTKKRVMVERMQKSEFDGGAAQSTLNSNRKDVSAATMGTGQSSKRNEARSQTLMDAFPSPNKDLKNVKFG